MDDKAARRGGRRRPVVVARELEKRRNRRMDRRIAARERQLRIDAAERQYFDAGEAIEVATRDLAAEITGYEERLAQAKAHTTTVVEQHRHQQSRVAAAIRGEGCTVDEVAEILDISRQQARQMIAEARRRDQTGLTLGNGSDSSTAAVAQRCEDGHVEAELTQPPRSRRLRLSKALFVPTGSDAIVG